MIPGRSGPPYRQILNIINNISFFGTAKALYMARRSTHPGSFSEDPSLARPRSEVDQLLAKRVRVGHDIQTPAPVATASA